MSRILYDQEKIGGAMVAEAVDHVVEAQNLINRAKSLMDAITVGGTVKANLEGSAEFGVVAASGANGTAFYETVNGMKTNISAITAAAIASIDMGG
jgi:coenzyme F420-reducing hydrogenase alpha subunit